MEMNAIKITTDAIGRRVGTIVNVNHEKAIQDNNNSLSYQEELLYKILRSEVQLIDSEHLTEGTYALTQFKEVLLAASYVATDQPTPSYASIARYRHIGIEMDGDFF